MDRIGKARLKALGLSYRAYLASEPWRRFRARYWASHERLCSVCGSTRPGLHHLTYERLGHERFSDVVPLCAADHRALHNAQRRHRKRYLSVAAIRAVLAHRRKP